MIKSFIVKVEDIYNSLGDWIPLEYRTCTEHNGIWKWCNMPMVELEKDIEENGIKEPLEVIYLSPIKKYLVIHGHHRLYEIYKLGIKTVPCIFASKRRLDDYIYNLVVLGGKNEFNQ